MIRTLTLEADLATIPDVVGVAARTVVALPPSDLDYVVTITGGGFGDFADQFAGTAPITTVTGGDMRVYIGGRLHHRAYDSTLEAN